LKFTLNEGSVNLGVTKKQYDDRVAEIRELVAHNDLSRATKRLMDFASDFISPQKWRNEVVLIRASYQELSESIRIYGKSQEMDISVRELREQILSFLDNCALEGNREIEDHESNHTPGKWLHKFRVDAGLSMGAFAKSCGISESNIRRYELDRQALNLDNAERILEYLNVPEELRESHIQWLRGRPTPPNWQPWEPSLLSAVEYEQEKGAALSFGHWFHLLRQALGLSQADVAKKVNRSQQKIALVESGKGYLSRSEAEQLAITFHIPPEEREVFIKWAQGQELRPDLSLLPTITSTVMKEPLMDDEQRRHFEVMRQNHVRRLRVLEEQAAITGINTQPEVRIEIEVIQAAIAEIDAKLVVVVSRMAWYTVCLTDSRKA
jgi:transcriptional regulator with XRE-family HTH domain